MRIGIVTTWFERGAAYVSRQFMDVLSKTDEVFIYARGGERYAKGDPKWDLPNVYWGKKSIGRQGILGSTYIDRSDFERWIKRNDIEVVLFNEQQWFQPILWCKDLNVKSLAYVDYYNETTIPLFAAYDGLICNTKRHAFAFRNHFNTNYLKWGTDTELFKPQHNNHKKLTFFHSAGMAPVRKGTDILLKAFYEIENKDSALLLIHTQVELTTFFPELKSMIGEMVSEGVLEVVTDTITAPGLYYRGDVYVYPSRLDGIGLTLMEAISSGLAVITSDNPPMNEFVEPSFGQLCKIDYEHSRADGYYWPICEPSKNALTVILQKYIDGEYDLNKMSQSAREYAINELDFDRNCATLHRIIDKTEIKDIDNTLIDEINKYDFSSYKKFYLIFSPIYHLFKMFKEMK